MRKFLVILFAAVLILGFMGSAQADLRAAKKAPVEKPTPSPIPEPLTLALLGGGLVGLYGLTKKLGKD